MIKEFKGHYSISIQHMVAADNPKASMDYERLSDERTAMDIGLEMLNQGFIKKTVTNSNLESVYTLSVTTAPPQMAVEFEALKQHNRKMRERLLESECYTDDLNKEIAELKAKLQEAQNAWGGYSHGD
jgi:hypothetical protein